MSPARAVEVQHVEEEDFFETSQTACAAFLVYCGHGVERTVWENHTCTFIFQQSEELANDFGEFIRSQASVEPVAFSNAFAQCIALVRTARDREKARVGLREHQRLEDQDSTTT